MVEKKKKDTFEEFHTSNNHKEVHTAITNLVIIMNDLITLWSMYAPVSRSGNTHLGVLDRMAPLAQTHHRHL